jgi:hypothetical protein
LYCTCDAVKAEDPWSSSQGRTQAVQTASIPKIKTPVRIALFFFALRISSPKNQQNKDKRQMDAA